MKKIISVLIIACFFNTMAVMATMAEEYHTIEEMERILLEKSLPPNCCRPDRWLKKHLKQYIMEKGGLANTTEREKAKLINIVEKKQIKNNYGFSELEIGGRAPVNYRKFFSNKMVNVQIKVDRILYIETMCTSPVETEIWDMRYIDLKRGIIETRHAKFVGDNYVEQIEIKRIGDEQLRYIKRCMP